MSQGASVQDVKIRRVNPAAYTAECNAAAALFIAARQLMLPHLAPLHTEEETLRWMQEVVFPRHSVWLAEANGERVHPLAPELRLVNRNHINWTGELPPNMEAPVIPGALLRHDRHQREERLAS